ncbi:hypothetical protein TorRG33x02_236470 [Trema orientale]|uniref:Uncharacterized protein n=1 Tax=Trema orientale TaxID=63057 RepID=A0A2P5E0S1_TREOI|nr:hypothetical protein TorRG33x02_236470 [Trema orientale]
MTASRLTSFDGSMAKVVVGLGQNGVRERGGRRRRIVEVNERGK